MPSPVIHMDVKGLSIGIRQRVIIIALLILKDVNILFMEVMTDMAATVKVEEEGNIINSL
jgi:hypothetical protein